MIIIKKKQVPTSDNGGIVLEGFVFNSRNSDRTTGGSPLCRQPCSSTDVVRCMHNRRRHISPRTAPKTTKKKS